MRRRRAFGMYIRVRSTVRALFAQIFLVSPSRSSLLDDSTPRCCIDACTTSIRVSPPLRDYTTLPYIPCPSKALLISPWYDRLMILVWRRRGRIATGVGFSFVFGGVLRNACLHCLASFFHYTGRTTPTPSTLPSPTTIPVY